MGTIKRTITIVATTATAKIYPFPQDDVLQNALSVDLIEAFKVGDVSLAPANGETVVSDTVFKKSFLTIVSGDEDVVYKIPLSSLNRKDNGGFVVPLNLKKIQVTRCNISIPESTGLTAGEAWVLCVHYTK